MNAAPRAAGIHGVVATTLVWVAIVIVSYWIQSDRDGVQSHGPPDPSLPTGLAPGGGRGQIAPQTLGSPQAGYDQSVVEFQYFVGETEMIRWFGRVTGRDPTEIMAELDRPEERDSLRLEYEKLARREVLARGLLRNYLLPIAEEKYAMGQFEVCSPDSSGSLDVEEVIIVVGDFTGPPPMKHIVRFKKGADPRADAAWDVQEGALLILRERAQQAVASWGTSR